MKYICLFFCFLFFGSAFCQLSASERVKIDSLKYVIAYTSDDSVKVVSYVAWDELIYISNPELDFNLNSEIIKICEKNLAKNLSQNRTYFFLKEIGYAYNNIATYEEQIGNNYAAIEHLKLSAKIGEYLKIPRIEANAYNNLGNNYRAINQFEKSIELYQKSLFFIKQSENTFNEAVTYNNIGLVYVDKHQTDSAMNYYLRALEMFKAMEAPDGLSLVYFNLGLVFKEQNNYDSAKYYYNIAYENATKIGDKNRMSSCLNKLGEITLIDENSQFNRDAVLKLSLELFNQSIELAEQGQGILEQLEALSNKYKTLEELKQFEEAYLTLKKFQNLKYFSDSLSNEKAILENDFQQDFKNKAAIDSLKYQQASTLNSEKLQNEKRQKYFLLSGLLLVVLLAYTLYYRFKESRKKAEIIKHQKQLVEEKQQEILDSIAYAKRIQNAILPPKDFIDKLNLNYHLTYLPKDIVAGDFYWIHDYNNFLFIAVADCTGHGVPGALVSIVCHNCLNRSIKEFSLTNPGEILDKTRELLVTEFSKSAENVNDGMDISLLVLNKKNNTAQWAGANNPIWILAKSKPEIIEIKPDKQPIGLSINPCPFKSHLLEIQKGDRIYLFTDGLQDQFGRYDLTAKPKKFKASRMKEILFNAGLHVELKTQCQQLTNEVITWKNDQTQTDDMCLLAIEFK